MRQKKVSILLVHCVNTIHRDAGRKSFGSATYGNVVAPARFMGADRAFCERKLQKQYFGDY